MEFTLSEFEKLVGTDFVVGDDGPVLTLAEAEADGQTGREGGAFTLLFHGPMDVQLAQGTFALKGGGQEMSLFLVPVGPRGEHLRYEAVFN
ncbi:MAG: hypothetical protein AAGD13_13075 [Pseudomonadota bacterium]